MLQFCLPLSPILSDSRLSTCIFGWYRTSTTYLFFQWFDTACYPVGVHTSYDHWLWFGFSQHMVTPIWKCFDWVNKGLAYIYTWHGEVCQNLTSEVIYYHISKHPTLILLPYKVTRSQVAEKSTMPSFIFIDILTHIYLWNSWFQVYMKLCIPIQFSFHAFTSINMYFLWSILFPKPPCMLFWVSHEKPDVVTMVHHHFWR
jgi:hypothetical protein